MVFGRRVNQVLYPKQKRRDPSVALFKFWDYGILYVMEDQKEKVNELEVKIRQLADRL